jgi:hypothetical protein
MNKNTWYGKEKYFYEVYNKDCRKIYTCVSTRDDQQSVINEIVRMFDDRKSKCRIKCNGKTVTKLNYKISTRQKRILDKNTGYIYENIKDMKEDLFITEKEAFNYVKNLMRYQWMD